MSDKLTTKSQEAVAAALQDAAGRGNPSLEPVHLLAALAQQDGGVARALLQAVEASPADVASRANAEISRLPGASGSSVSQPQASRPMLSAIQAAGEEASALGDDYVSTEHLLLALAKSSSSAGDILRSVGATREQIAAVLPTVRGSGKVTSPDPEGTFQALEKY
ncbi:MAG: ATP-dependent chaperone ClpB, partial [Ruaniaceae bacterium]|nr:ATP-dependent chaperone ClpB [Ruaniaceae bacterium]